MDWEQALRKARKKHLKSVYQQQFDGTWRRWAETKIRADRMRTTGLKVNERQFNSWEKKAMSLVRKSREVKSAWQRKMSNLMSNQRKSQRNLLKRRSRLEDTKESQS